MRRTAQWFWRRYPDDQLAFVARKALAADPRLLDVTHVSITCVKGVLRLTGRVRSRREKSRWKPTFKPPYKEQVSPISAFTMTSTYASSFLQRVLRKERGGHPPRSPSDSQGVHLDRERRRTCGSERV